MECGGLMLNGLKYMIIDDFFQFFYINNNNCTLEIVNKYDRNCPTLRYVSIVVYFTSFSANTLNIL